MAQFVIPAAMQVDGHSLHSTIGTQYQFIYTYPPQKVEEQWEGTRLAEDRARAVDEEEEAMVELYGDQHKEWRQIQDWMIDDRQFGMGCDKVFPSYKKWRE